MSSDAWLLPSDPGGRIDEERSVDIGPPGEAESYEEIPPQVEESVETARDTDPPD